MAEQGEVNIAFRTEADLKGADQMAKAVGAMRDQFAHMPKELSELSKKQDEAGKSGKELSGRFTALKDAAKGLAFEFPILGRVIQLATNPIAIIAAATVTAVSAFLEWSKAIDEALKRVQALATFKKTLDSLSVSQHAVAIAVEAYNEAVKKSGTNDKSAQDALDARLIATTKLIDLQKELIAAETKLAVLKVQTSAKTPEEKARLIAGLEGGAAGAMSGRTNAEMNAQQNAIRSKISTAQRTVSEVGSQIEGAASSSKTAADNAAIANEAVKIEAEDIIAEEARVKYEESRKMPLYNEGKYGSASKLKAARADLERRKGPGMDSLKKNAQQRAAEAKKAADRVATMREKGTAASGEILSATTELGRLQSEATQGEPFRNRQDAIADESRKITADKARVDAANKVLEEQGFGFRYATDTITQGLSPAQAHRDFDSFPGLKPSATKQQKEGRAQQVGKWFGENLNRDALDKLAGEFSRMSGQIVDVNEAVLRMVRLHEIHASGITGALSRLAIVESRVNNNPP
jgi:hypothetical protein